jgi:hypothetical protein
VKSHIRIANLPARITVGAFILHAGLGKLSADQQRPNSSTPWRRECSPCWLT